MKRWRILAGKGRVGLALVGILLGSVLEGCRRPAPPPKPVPTESVESKVAAVLDAVTCPVPGDPTFAETESTRGVLAAERTKLDPTAYYRAALHFRRATVCAPEHAESKLREERARAALATAVATARFSEHRAPSARTARHLRQLLGEALPRLGHVLLVAETQRARMEATRAPSR